jgi:hypothetical protein
LTVSEEELLRRLGDGSLPASEFSHRNHVRAAWHCLRQGASLRDSAHGFRDLLLHYVRAIGAEDKFHQTLTLAFMHIIHARMGEAGETWDAFAARNPDLFSSAQSLIARHYTAARMAAGRVQFAEPDGEPLPM